MFAEGIVEGFSEKILVSNMLFYQWLKNPHLPDFQSFLQFSEEWTRSPKALWCYDQKVGSSTYQKIQTPKNRKILPWLRCIDGVGLEGRMRPGSFCQSIFTLTKFQSYTHQALPSLPLCDRLLAGKWCRRFLIPRSGRGRTPKLKRKQKRVKSLRPKRQRQKQRHDCFPKENKCCAVLKRFWFDKLTWVLLLDSELLIKLQTCRILCFTFCEPHVQNSGK